MARTIEEVILSKVPFYLIIKNIVTDVTNTESATDLRPALVSFDHNAVLGFIVVTRLFPVLPREEATAAH